MQRMNGERYFYQSFWLFCFPSALRRQEQRHTASLLSGTVKSIHRLSSQFQLFYSSFHLLALLFPKRNSVCDCVHIIFCTILNYPMNHKLLFCRLVYQTLPFRDNLATGH
jgi:hypothetical protein